MKNPNRRQWLKALFGAGAALFLPPAARSSSRRRLLQESPLAGFNYHAGERLWAAFYVGAPLSLVREPKNPHDERAVAVHFAGARIGYVPRMENTAVAQLLDRGERLTARIVGLCESTDPWQRLRLAVDWEPPYT